MRHVWAFALLIGTMMGWSAPTGALAQSAWETMHPDSFPATTTAARQQCDRTAWQSPRDALTLAKCEQFELVLATGQCQQGVVPDGTIFAYMNYHHAGQSPSVAGSTVKRLGSNQTPATICDLGDGVTAYWFNETGVGCNNVAFQLPRRQIVAVTPTPRKPVCKMVKVETSQTYLPGSSFGVGGFNADGTWCAPGINIPGIYGSTPGSVQKSTTWVQVCE